MPAYMKLGDIKGDVAAAADAAHGSGGGGGAWKVSVHDISLASVADGTSGDLAAEGDAAAGLDHGVTVLAWARVDGTSHAAPFEPGFRGGVFVGATDDVVVDGRIITGADPVAATHELGHTLGFRHEHGEAATGGDAAPDAIIVAAGPGGGPHVKVFDSSAATDGDGDVDGQDFLIWQRGGSPGAVGGGDLADWQGNYGSGGAASAGADDDLLIGGLTGFGDAGGRSVDLVALSDAEVVWTDGGTAGSTHSGGVNMSFGDGSVRFVSDDMGLL